jgi:hypothetical protein
MKGTNWRNIMKLIKGFSLAIVLLFATGVRAQTIGGVDAPNAISLRITRVATVSTPEVLVAGSTTTTESSSGNTITAQSATTRYTLSCIIVERTERQYGETTVTIDGGFKNYSNGGFTWMPQCGDFHVEDVVTFYSLEHLVWLSYARGKDTFTHNDRWKPEYANKDLFTLFSRWTVDLSAAADASEELQRSAGINPIVKQPRSHSYAMYEHWYWIDSEEEIAAPVVQAQPHKVSPKVVHQ